MRRFTSPCACSLHTCTSHFRDFVLNLVDFGIEGMAWESRYQLRGVEGRYVYLLCLVALLLSPFSFLLSFPAVS